MRLPAALNDGMAEIYLNYAAYRVSSEGKIYCFYAVCTPRQMQSERTGRLKICHLLVFVSFEERCINFQLILANIAELAYANAPTFELCKALEHHERDLIDKICRPLTRRKPRIELDGEWTTHSSNSGSNNKKRIARKLFTDYSWTAAMTASSTIRLLVVIVTVIRSTVHDTKAI
ncbi:uncharacterized protein EAE97_008692 [Botrytis byssoidea]|uniref:Uncharacterized protein n=1 Tax=Botrytis byssoidea TaxID=139641 RepID=A0A9P5IAD9_9HELO|nr:uncharacterized protein EAE97_008692 [Botrytis byssoidea]KAF7932925.1 hypothetical protein EAE97_008692 [Botrytis byssoidea]